MKSLKPKVLHHLAGKSMLAHVLDGVSILNPVSTTVVIGHGSEQVQEEITHSVEWAMQAVQLGTGHAVQQAMHNICLLYTSPSPRDKRQSRMPSSA